jgi:hypothetical protein
LGIFIKVRFGSEIATIKFELEFSQMMTARRLQEMSMQSQPESGYLAFDSLLLLRSWLIELQRQYENAWPEVVPSQAG